MAGKVFLILCKKDDGCRRRRNQWDKIVSCAWLWIDLPDFHPRPRLFWDQLPANISGHFENNQTCSDNFVQLLLYLGHDRGKEAWGSLHKPIWVFFSCPRRILRDSFIKDKRDKNKPACCAILKHFDSLNVSEYKGLKVSRSKDLYVPRSQDLHFLGTLRPWDI